MLGRRFQPFRRTGRCNGPYGSRDPFVRVRRSESCVSRGERFGVRMEHRRPGPLIGGAAVQAGPRALIGAGVLCSRTARSTKRWREGVRWSGAKCLLSVQYRGGGLASWKASVLIPALCNLDLEARLAGYRGQRPCFFERRSCRFGAIRRLAGLLLIDKPGRQGQGS